MPDADDLHFLEPSAGDGAFLRGITESVIAERTAGIVAIEPLEIEAEKCRRVLRETKFSASIQVESAVDWGATTNESFDAAVGNPPFVRYQFVSSHDKEKIGKLGERIGISFAGVSNLWLPVLGAAIARLKPKGAFSFVVPSELLTGSSASHLRRWLLANTSQLSIDLFAPGSFPAVLQEVVVLSGRRAEGDGQRAELTLTDHNSVGRHSWTHSVDSTQVNWTRYLLSPSQLAALQLALENMRVTRLDSIARFQVSIVTGANNFFCVPDYDRAEFELEPWSKPLLPRLRHAPGLLYSCEDHGATLDSNARSWLLDFSAEAPEPLSFARPTAYLERGEKQDLPARYKCKIRDPWYRVPNIETGELLLSKRSHRIARIIVNEAGVYTTDTIYRGRILPDATISAQALSACFHSSLTLLSAELEGRSFGGGVLELVPSEIGRLAVTSLAEAEKWLPQLDSICRESGEEALVEATDALLINAGGLEEELAGLLAAARQTLVERRLARSSRAGSPIQDAFPAAA